LAQRLAGITLDHIRDHIRGRIRDRTIGGHAIAGTLGRSSQPKRAESGANWTSANWTSTDWTGERPPGQDLEKEVTWRNAGEQRIAFSTGNSPRN